MSVYLDPQGRTPDDLMRAWRDFGATAAASVRAGAGVTMVQASYLEARRVVDGVPCHFIHPSRLPAVVAESGPDVIHWQGLLFPLQLRALARRFPGIPVVAQDHGSAVPRRRLQRWVHRWGFGPLAAVMFTATEQADAFKTAGVLRRDLPVFPVIEGSTPFAPGDQTAARTATGLAGDPCLLWVGNLDANKDPLTVLDAVAGASGDLPGLRLWMCYRFAPLLAQVRERIERDRALRERVHLLGEVSYPGVERYFQAADFLVQASHKEGSGYGVIESLACGTPVLVTDIPSFRTITGQGIAGALFPLGDAPALAGAIRDWAGRDRDTLRRSVRAHFDRALSYDSIGRQLAAVYRQLGQAS